MTKTRFWKITLVALCAGLLFSLPVSAEEETERPNIVLLLADDLGWGELGCFGQQHIRTPRLDQMADEGMILTDFYAGSTVCAPSRSVLLLGRHTGRSPIRGNRYGDTPLPEQKTTVAQLLQQAGYATAVVGKWGLGRIGTSGQPDRQGFDYFFGYENHWHAHNYYPTHLFRNTERVDLPNVVPDETDLGAGVATEKAVYGPDLVHQEALDFIRQNRRRPFFLYYAHLIPHANNEATRAVGDGTEVPDLGPYADKDWTDQDRGHAAMITYLDQQVGELMDLLVELEIAENTLVLFTSDNGPHRESGQDVEFFNPSGPLRGFKRDLYEGGVRVPTIAWWPGRIAAGSVSDHIADFADFLPTAAELAGTELPATIDGVSFLPTLIDRPDQPQERPYLYWEFYEQGSAQAVRMGRWKAVRRPAFSGPIELYDLSVDLGEANDVADEHAEVVGQIERILEEAHEPDPGWEPRGRVPDPPPPGLGLSFSKPLRISKQTVYITEPLTADGKQVDYFAAIDQATRPENFATDENGYRLIVQHLGKSLHTDGAHFEVICKALGLNGEAIQPDMTFEDPHDFLAAYIESDEFDETLLEDFLHDDARNGEEVVPLNLVLSLQGRLGQPWTLDDLPMMAQWLDENNPALDLIGRSVAQPTWYIPSVRQSADVGIRVPSAELQRVRSFARGLQARAHYRIAVGDIDAAIDDIIACKRLARHLGQDGSLIELLFGIATDGIADAIGIAGSLEHLPTNKQLQRLFDEEKKLPPKADVNQMLRFKRFTMLDMVQALANGDNAWSDFQNILRDFRDIDRPLPADLGFDWNVVAQRFNEHYDRSLATHQEAPAWNSDRTDEFFHPLPRVRAEALADVLGHMGVPAANAAREAVRRNKCTNHMKHLVLAMLIYEREHGTLPPAYSVDQDGRPLHSWRVLLLPYLGHQTLYDKIRLDQPWDSEHNRQFHAEAVKFYRCRSHPRAARGQTTYSVVIGPDMPFEAGQGKPLADFGSNSDDMILVVERAEPVGWMDPTREIRQRDAEQGPHAFGVRPDGITSRHPGGANFGLRNGAVHFLTESIDPQHFREMLQGTYEDE